MSAINYSIYSQNMNFYLMARLVRGTLRLASGLGLPGQCALLGGLRGLLLPLTRWRHPHNLRHHVEMYGFLRRNKFRTVGKSTKKINVPPTQSAKLNQSFCPTTSKKQQSRTVTFLTTYLGEAAVVVGLVFGRNEGGDTICRHTTCFRGDFT